MSKCKVERAIVINCPETMGYNGEASCCAMDLHGLAVGFWRSHAFLRPSHVQRTSHLGGTGVAPIPSPPTQRIPRSRSCISGPVRNHHRIPSSRYAKGTCHRRDVLVWCKKWRNASVDSPYMSTHSYTCHSVTSFPHLLYNISITAHVPSQSLCMGRKAWPVAPLSLRLG